MNGQKTLNSAITLAREEAQQVLDALIWTTGSEDFSETGKARVGAIKVLFPAIETLRARLSAPEPEPVAWQGLTDEELDLLWVDYHGDSFLADGRILDYERAIEAKLREKNT